MSEVTAIGFERQVRDRLLAGAETYGDRSFQRPLAELLDEIGEECADIAGWGRIALGVLEHREDLEDWERDAIAEALRAAERLAAAAWRHVDRARSIVREADREGAAS